MKLPSFKQTATPSLASVNPQIYANVPRQGNYSEAVKGFGKVLTNMAIDYEKTEIDRQVSEADTAFTLSKTAFDSEHVGQEVYDNSLIPESLKAKHGIIEEEGQTPSYVVQADWRYDAAKDAIQQQSMHISNYNVRQKWVQGKLEKAAQTYHKDMVARSRLQHEHVIKEGKQRIADLINVREFDPAMDVVASLHIEEGEKRILQNGIEASRQTMYLTDHMEPLESQTPKEHEQQVASILQSLVEDDLTVTGQLSDTARKQWINTYQAELNRIHRQADAQDNGQQKLMKYYAGLAISNLQNGIEVDPNELNKFIDYAEKSGDLVLQQKLHSAAELYDDVQDKFSRFTPATILHMQNQFDNEPQGTLEGNHNQQIRSLAQKESVVFATTPMDYVEKYRSVDLKPLDYSNLDQSLEQRFEDWVTAEGHYKQTFETGLTSFEAQRFDQILSEGDENTVLAVANSVQSAWGSHSHKFWDQLQKYGYGGAATVAGQMVTDHNATGAKMVLEGVKIRKELPTILDKMDRTKVEAAIDEAIIGVYPTVEQAGLIHKAAVALAYYQANNGSRINPEDIVRMAVGNGVADFKGSRYLLPAGKTENMMDNWFDELSPTYFSDVDATQFAGVTQENVGEYVKKRFTKTFGTDIKLMPTGDRGSWYLKDTRTGVPIRNTDGSLATLKYTETPRTIYDD